MPYTPEIGDTVEAAITVKGKVLRVGSNTVDLRLADGSEYGTTRNRTHYVKIADPAVAWHVDDVVWHDSAAWTRERGQQWTTPKVKDKLHDQDVDRLIARGLATILVKDGQPAGGGA